MSGSISEPFFKIIQIRGEWQDGAPRGTKNVIYLIGNSPKFLEEKWNLIVEYTKKIDPKAKLGVLEIREIQNPKLLKDGYTHAIAIHSILPRIFHQLFGPNPHKGNCHGAALLSAGIFLKLYNTYYPQSFLQNNFKFNQTNIVVNTVALEQLSVGDWVYLPKHSFVFLDHDISISMNGEGADLEIQRTADILKEYNYSVDTLKTTNPEPEQELKTFRKNENWNYPEELIQKLAEYFSINWTLFNCQTPDDPYYERVKEIRKELRDFYKKASENSAIQPEVKEIWKDVVNSCRGINDERV